MTCETHIVVAYEGINFSAHAVARKELGQWLDMAGKQFFQSLSEEARSEKLTEVYNLCKEAVIASLPKPPEEVAPEVSEEVPDTPNTKRQRRGNSPNKDEVVTDSET